MAAHHHRAAAAAAVVAAAAAAAVVAHLQFDVHVGISSFGSCQIIFWGLHLSQNKF